MLPSETHKVLVIDDELGPRESIRMLLKPLYQVLCAERPENGLELLQQEKPHLVILDIRMPGTDGIECLRRIRALDSLVSVVMLTGYGSLETAREAIRLGANDYLRKPFEIQDLQKVVGEQVQRTLTLRDCEQTQQTLKELNQQLAAELRNHDALVGLGQASEELVHDLRNPLFVVQASTELLELLLSHGSVNTEVAQYLETIQKSIQRCRDLLDVWRHLGARSRLNLQPSRVDQILENLRSEAETLAKQRKVALHILCPSGIGFQADPRQFPRALMNVIGNAIDAVEPESGEVRVLVSPDESSVTIRIRDNGPGIPEQLHEQIFSPAYSTKSNTKGTGLGLYISRRIIEKHGGSLTVRNRSGGGAEFKMNFPFEVPASSDNEKIPAIPAF